VTSTSRRDNRPESRDKEDAFVLGNKAKDLYIYTSEAIGNTNIIPKHRRHTAGQRLKNMTFEIMDKCYLANTKSLKTKREERQALQEEIMALCLVSVSVLDKEGKITRREIEESLQAWNAHAKHGDTRTLRQQMRERVDKIFKEARNE